MEENDEISVSKVIVGGGADTEVDVTKAVSEFKALEQSLQEEEAKERIKENGGGLEEGIEGFNIRAFFEDSVRKELAKGHKEKKMGLIIKDLTVEGFGAEASSIDDNISYLRHFWPPNWFKKPKGALFDILHKVSAFCKDGEMLLVLGRPGSGCSTFLRVAANERSIYASVKGEVSYGGIPAEDFGPYRGEALYVPEEDTHFPTITLKETLTFALRTKTPGNRFSGETRRMFRQRVFNSLVKMFGLVNQAYTLVGNEFVRGLSGGERKRTTITEAMVNRSAINCWDCSTRGLDAASALDYAKSLRIITETLHKTTVASFYQASDAIYEQFDRVLVLDKGRVLYFGPTHEAKQYFIDLGFECEMRRTTPDFLTGVSNPQERLIRKGYEDTAPRNSVEMEEAFLKSENYARAMHEMREYEQQIKEEKPYEDFKQEVLHSKAKRAHKKSIYTSSIWEQLYALTVRAYLIFIGDRFNLFSRYFSAVALGFIYSSVFFQMPLTSQGGFLRGGAIFASIFFNCFIASSEVFGSFFGRRIIQKQKSYAMYHPGLHHLAQVILDIPVLFVQSFIFGTISYWMFGLDADAGKYFTHIFFLTVNALCTTSIVRLLGNGSPSVYLTQQLMGLVFVLMFIYLGFTLTHYQMHPWLGWIYWINPFAYTFKGFFSNEFRGLVFECTSDGYIPYGSTYTDPAYRVCALPGARPGETTVKGEVYLKTTYDFDVDEMTLDIMVVLMFWLFFTVINFYLVETANWAAGGFMMKVFKKGKAPKRNLELELENARLAAKAADEMPKIEMRAGIFLWKEIKYTVPVHDGYRVLLEGVSGWIKPGQMTALMGASGAGKTTLLDVLAQRKTQGVVEGTMLLNGRPLGKDFERITGYVEQMDVHNPLLTVREALQFSAKLRQESSVPLEEKLDYVEKVLEMMEMKDLGDALIGDLDSGIGISVEERKRLTIGMELVAKPHILFLDEPTSGLDAQSSFNIIKFIRKLADAGMPLICTIHQPSSVLFEYFDRLLLVATGGKVVYFGETGDKSRTLLEYFERNGARQCSEVENPAEYILEAIGAGVGGKTDKDWVSIWRESPEAIQVERELAENEKAGRADSSSEKATEFASSRTYQTIQLLKRFNIIYWRNPNYNIGRVLQALLVGLSVGFSFWNIGNSTSDLVLLQLTIMMALILGVMIMFGAIPQFLVMREFFKRDYASKYYSSFPFAFSMNFVELPYLIFFSSITVICCFWSSGIDTGTSFDGFFFWLMFTVFVFYCHSVGVFVAAMSPHANAAIVLLSVLMAFLFLLAGVFIPPPNMPTFWHSWAYPLNPFHYFMEAIVSTVLAPLTVKCSQADLLHFYAPPNQTCGEYTTEFFKYATGYINNPDASGTTLCEYCQYKSGNEYLGTLDWSVHNRWRDFGLLIGYWVFNMLIGVIFVYIFRKQRSYVLETYLDIRQHKNYKIKVIPDKIKSYDLITQEQFEKSQLYGLDKSNFGFFHDFVNFLQITAALLFGFLPFLWGFSLKVLQRFGYSEDYEILQSLVFTVNLVLITTFLALPFELYSIFVIEERHGFNKQTLGLFFVDKIKSFCLFLVIGLPILYAILVVIRWGDLWLFCMVVMLVMVTIYPTLIAPLFNKFSTLPEGELRDKIYALAKRVDFPLTKLYTVDGSKRSGHSNAYFYGFFKNKRIVLYDTLLEHVDITGIIAVLAHELAKENWNNNINVGHFKMNHTYKNLFISQLYMLLFLFLFGQSINNKDLFASFGFSTQPALIGLTLFSLVYEPVDNVFSFLMHGLSRHFEYQADEYAVKLGYDLTEALAKLSNSNLSSLIIDPLYSAYHHTHPTLIERIDNIATLKKKYKVL